MNEIDVIKIKAIEERVFKNLNGVLDRMKTIESKINEIEHRLAAFKGHMIAQEDIVGELKKQLALLQQSFYAKGTTSYGDNDRLANEGGDGPTE